MKKLFSTFIICITLFSMAGIASAATTSWQTLHQLRLNLDDSSTPTCTMELEDDNGSRSTYTLENKDVEKISWCQAMGLTAMSTGRKIFIEYNSSTKEIQRVWLQYNK